MGLFNWLMHRKMKKEAARLASKVPDLYYQSKSRLGNVPETEIITKMVFSEETITMMSESEKAKLDTCCSTVNGLCYLIALDLGSLKGIMTFRALQFTHYMDVELAKVGFYKQTKGQKERILKAMDLAIDGWEEWTMD